MPMALHCSVSPVSAIIAAAPSATAASPARLMPSARAPLRAACTSVNGGMTLDSSVKNFGHGEGSGGLNMPSDMPRSGSRRVSTHSASSSPGRPTARKAACQPTRPRGPPPGKALFQLCTMSPPMNSDRPPPM